MHAGKGNLVMSTEDKMNFTEGSTSETLAEKKNIKKTVGFGIAIIFFVCLILFVVYYFVRQNHYREYYFTNTTINGISCGEKTSDGVTAQLLSTYLDYSLSVKGCDGTEVGCIQGTDINVNTVLNITPKDILGKQQTMKWIFENNKNHNYDIDVSFSYDEDKLDDFFDHWNILDEGQMTPATDAYIGDYDFEKKAYVIVPDRFGTELDIVKVRDIVRNALIAGENEVSIADCYIPAKVRQDDKLLVARLNRINQFIGAQISYDWYGVQFMVDSDLIHDWITIGKGSISLDKEKVHAFAEECAALYDTYGKERNFKTIHGDELLLPCGAYGWKTDIEKETDELYQLVLDGKKTSKEPVFVSEGKVKGQDDIGDSFIEIDLTNQHLYVWIDGVVDFESDVVSGCKAKRNSTPPGVFGVTYKARNATLKGPTWNSFVRYWMPFNKSIGMHDASWRKTFGGDIYLNDGSHGCVNLPRESAAKIYDVVSKGFPVICYYLPEADEA